MQSSNEKKNKRLMQESFKTFLLRQSFQQHVLVQHVPSWWWLYATME